MAPPPLDNCSQARLRIRSVPQEPRKASLLPPCVSGMLISECTEHLSESDDTLTTFYTFTSQASQVDAVILVYG